MTGDLEFAGEGTVRVKQPGDLLVFRGLLTTRDEGGVEGRGRRIGIEVLSESVRGDCSKVREEVLG